MSSEGVKHQRTRKETTDTCEVRVEKERQEKDNLRRMMGDILLDLTEFENWLILSGKSLGILLPVNRKKVIAKVSEVREQIREALFG